MSNLDEKPKNFDVIAEKKKLIYYIRSLLEKDIICFAIVCCLVMVKVHVRK